jgi:palmitoyltransferase
MLYLESFLYTRCALLWSNRRLPSYLGPSVFQLVHLFLLVVTNSLVLFALILLLGRTIWSTALNMTTIESWELERHHTLLRRARVLGGYLHGPEGKKIRIEHQEFPWDVGIWKNFAAAFGTRNIFAWFWPLERTIPAERGFKFEHNGIDDPGMPWPPPDPDRLFRVPRRDLAKEENGFTKDLDVDAFRERQRADLARYADADGEFVVRRKPFHERLEEMQRAERAEQAYDPAETAIETDEESESSGSESDDEAHVVSRREDNKDDGGEEAWRNKEGERLADFGVDEVAEFYDEDDLPLVEIIRRKKAEQSDA